MGRILTPEQAARLSGLHVVTIRHKCESGILPAVNIGTAQYRQWRIREEDLVEFFTPESKRSQVQAEKPTKRQRLDANVTRVL
jgi:excisionase family DNA binding protein